MRTEGNPNSLQRQARIVGQIEISITTWLQKSNCRFCHSTVILSNTVSEPCYDSGTQTGHEGDEVKVAFVHFITLGK